MVATMNKTIPIDNSPKLKCPWCIAGIDDCYCSQEEIKKYYEQQDQIDSEESPYCAKCGSCGETGCCPPINCEAVVCQYGEINLKDYKCFQDQWEVMFNALKELWEFDGNVVARDALNEVDKLWDKLYSKE
jgi:hypothetical protein